MQQFAEFVSNENCAVPIGTGQTVGVYGFVLNGGQSGFFSRRLGLLGQNVIQLQIVFADGSFQELVQSSSSYEFDDNTNDNDDHHHEQKQNDDNDKSKMISIEHVLGAGSALGIVTSMTIRMESETSILGGGQIIIDCSSSNSSSSNNNETKQHCVRAQLEFMKEYILKPKNYGVSMDLWVKNDTTTANLIFFDAFVQEGEREIEDGRDEFIQPLLDTLKENSIAVNDCNMKQWKSWFDIASSQWTDNAKLVEQQQNNYNPISWLCHNFGTLEVPTDDLIEFCITEWFCDDDLFDLVPQTIAVARTNGGYSICDKRRRRRLATGNCHIDFFCILLVVYHANDHTTTTTTPITKQVEISNKVAEIMKSVRDKNNDFDEALDIDACATLCQPDDPISTISESKIVGGESFLRDLLNIKHIYDPNNRFRYHPFASFLK